MLHFPNCKINIGLYITGKRDDGYHNLETIFYPLPFCDILEIVPAAEASLTVTGLVIDQPKENNLAWKAYLLMRERFPLIGPLAIHLHKIIPTGAGLGGGSADAAEMMKMLNEYFQLGVSYADLATLSLELGSDCPFFIHNKPVFASGRGEQFKSVSLDLSQYSIQLIFPGISVSTKEAFSNIEPKAPGFDLKKISDLPVDQWKDLIENDFERTVFAAHPELLQIKTDIYRQGALYAAMSGSGSTVYAIFKKGIFAKTTYPYFYQE